MNETRKIRLFATAFILLVALNIATICAFFLFKKQPSPPPGGGGNAAAFLVKELGFDTSQKEQLMDLVQEHRRQVRELHDANREAKETFFDLLKEPSVSDSALAAAVQKAAWPDRQLDIYTFRHFQKVRALCNETQKKKFDEIIHEVLQMMAQPRGGPGPESMRPEPPPGGGAPPM
jgi:hypothetical protein